MELEHLELQGPALGIAVRQRGLMSHQQLLDSGFSPYQIYRRAAAEIWVRRARGVYDTLPRHPWADPFDAAREKSAWLGLLSVPEGIATGVSALALHGVWGLPQRIHPEVAARNGAYRRERKEVRIRRISGFATVAYFDRVIAAPVAAFSQALPELPRDYAVAALDSALHLGVMPPDALEEINRQLKGSAGVRRGRAWLSLADGLAQSPFETRVRLQCRDAGLPRPSLQVSIGEDQGRTVAHGDLGWQRPDGTWVLVDLDGRRYHDSATAIWIDRQRQNSIALTDRHTHLRFAWEDLRTGVIPRMVSEALRSRR